MDVAAGVIVGLVALSAGAGCGDAGPAGAGPGNAAMGGAGATSPGIGGEGGAAGTSPGDSGASGDTGGAGGAGPAGAAGASGGSGELPTRLARYHRSDADRTLRFELDAVAGLEPYASSLAYLESWVARGLDKPDGISFDVDESLAPVGSDHVWSFDALDAYSRSHASDDSDGPVSIHVLFVDGRYDSGEGGGTVLGLAWGQRHIALFQDALRSGCAGALTGALSSDVCELAERNVWAHEIGHVIGLVDNGLSQQVPHRDPDHGRHDVSNGCLMYWAYEGPAVFDVLLSRLGGGQSGDLDLCENCRADLQAARR